MEFRNLKPLKEITTLVKRGITPKYSSISGIQVINQRCIRDGKIDFNLVRNHDPNKNFNNEKKLKKYDVLVNSTGVGTLGRVAQFYRDNVEVSYTADSHVTIVRPEDHLNKIYFGYAIKEKENFIESMGEGSTGQTELSRIRLEEEVFINVPPIKTQNNIAKILLNIDKKIEINNKIIENLEAQAQAIFKSWFVDFEPFQDENFVESELGLIPEGWEVGKLGKSKLGKMVRSGIDEFKGEKVYLATADVSDTYINNILTRITFDDRPSRANMQPKPFSVWFAKMKDSRKLIFVDPTDDEILNNMIFSTGFAGIQANENSFTYLWGYLLTKYFDRAKNSYAMGTTMQAINNKNINNILVAVPTNSILESFTNITRPMIKLISSLRNQNEKLAQTRDTLLPKLMSGEIDVSNIKIDDEDSKDE